MKRLVGKMSLYFGKMLLESDIGKRKMYRHAFLACLVRIVLYALETVFWSSILYPTLFFMNIISNIHKEVSRDVKEDKMLTGNMAR